MSVKEVKHSTILHGYTCIRRYLATIVKMQADDSLSKTFARALFRLYNDNLVTVTKQFFGGESANSETIHTLEYII